MVVTVRWASDTARPATSVDFAACEAISPIEAASSSTEPAAVVTLSEAAATRCSAVRASADMVSAALLRSVELISSFMDAPRSLLSALSTECLNCAMVSAIVSLRCACARLASVCVGGELFALDHGVAEHDHGARHLADLVARVGGGNAGAGVAVGELLHHAGQAVERARDAAPDQPAETKAERDHGDADRDDAGARARLRRGRAADDASSAVWRARVDDFVRARQHALAVDIDHRAQRMHAVEAVDPLREGVGIGFHLAARARPSSPACRRSGRTCR